MINVAEGSVPVKRVASPGYPNFCKIKLNYMAKEVASIEMQAYKEDAATFKNAVLRNKS
jgi:hypothetical protein